MERREISISEKSKEKKSEEVQRFGLDGEKGIDIVIKTVLDVGLPQDLKDSIYEPAQIILEQKGKEILDFQKFLPKDYKYVFYGREIEEQKIDEELSGEIFYHDPVEKIIIIPRKWKAGSKDILSLLHEIGHSLDKELPQKMKQVVSWAGIIDEIEKVESETGEISEMGIKWAEKEFLKYLKLQSEMERFAWATALVIVRELKKEKEINLLKVFQGETAEETRKNLEEHIHGITGLGYAEKWDVVGGPFEEKFKGIFTTKIYKGEKFTPEHRKRIRKNLTP